MARIKRKPKPAEAAQVFTFELPAVYTVSLRGTNREDAARYLPGFLAWIQSGWETNPRYILHNPPDSRLTAHFIRISTEDARALSRQSTCKPGRRAKVK